LTWTVPDEGYFRSVSTKFNIHMFITIIRSIPLLVGY